MRIIKLFILIVTLNFIFVPSPSLMAQKKVREIKRELTLLKLKGNVKSYTETKFQAENKFGEINKVQEYKISYLFNNKGYQNEYYYYNGNGNLKQKAICEYNDIGYRIGYNFYTSTSLFLKCTYEYNIKGDTTVINTYDSNGALSYKCTFKYDDKENLAEHTLYKSDGNISLKKIYKYDEKDSIIEEVIYTDGGINEKNVYKYDTNGKKTVWNHFKSETIVSKVTTIYDNNGRKIQEETYKPYDTTKDDNLNSMNSFVDSKYTFNYDDNGNLIEIDIFLRKDYVSKGILGYYSASASPKLILNEKYFYKYNDNNKAIELKIYNLKNNVISNFYLKVFTKCDITGKIIEKNIYNSDESLKEKYTYKYDDKDNTIEINTFDSGNILKLKNNVNIIYDNEGNWINKTFLKNDIVQEIIEREYTYY